MPLPRVYSACFPRLSLRVRFRLSAFSGSVFSRILFCLFSSLRSSTAWFSLCGDCWGKEKDGSGVGFCLRRHRLSLPLWCAEGWLNPCGTGSPCRCGVRRGAEPCAALVCPAAVVRGEVAEPCAALARPAPGERTISNAEVPLPRSPLSLATGTAIRKAFPLFLHRAIGSLSQGTCAVRFVSAARVQPRGCKGRSPLHKITLSLPLPRRGRGSGGWGQESKLKARLAGDQNRCAPPPGTTVARSAGDQNRCAPPFGFLHRRLSQCRPGTAPGMQGAKPLA